MVSGEHNETVKHLNAKAFGFKILSAIGINNITFEHNLKDVCGRNFVADVYGEIDFKDRKIPIIIECGNVNSSEKVKYLRKKDIIVICLRYANFQEITICETIKNLIWSNMKEFSNKCHNDWRRKRIRK